jgi:hypothetical protein
VLEAVTRQRLVKTQLAEKTYVCTVVNCRVCDLTIALWLLAVTFCTSSVNPISNPNPVYSHTHTRDNIFKK